jgi:hypothetical protein
VAAVGTNARAARPGLSTPPSLGTSVRAALPAWILARVIVLATLAAAVVWWDGPLVAGPLSDVKTLQVWDVVWYRILGEEGYGPYAAAESRFFPLLPGVVGIGTAFGLPAVLWITAACWAAALGFAAALHRLTLIETGDDASARRAAWLVQLVPGANVLALGYTEALAGLLAVMFFLVIRTGRDGGVGTVAGLLSGLARPTGFLLSVPAAIELVRRRLERGWPRRLMLTAAPILGTCLYLGWAWHRFGDPLTPYRVHSAPDLRGGVASPPWEFLFRTSPGGYRWQLTLALLVVAGYLLYICARRLPISYTAWAVLTVGAAVTAYGLHSLPRYLAGVFPLAMAAALVCRNPWVWRAVLAACLPVFAWVSFLNLTPGPVP